VNQDFLNISFLGHSYTHILEYDFDSYGYLINVFVKQFKNMT